MILLITYKQAGSESNITQAHKAVRIKQTPKETQKEIETLNEAIELLENKHNRLTW